MYINQDDNNKENNSKSEEDLSTYKDEYIELNPNEIKINKYYFPFLTSKIIPINKIKKIELVELNAFNGKYK